MRPGEAKRVQVVALLATAAFAVACSSGSEGARPSTTDASPTTSALATGAVSIQPVGEHELPGTYRQGIAEAGDGWLFTNDKAIYRTDADFRAVAANEMAIPPELAARGYDHLGDGDVVDGVFWVPLERADKTTGEQVTARYDPKTLQFIDSFTVPQHHNAFVTVDDGGVAYSTDQFDDDTILRYRVTGSTVEALEPLQLSRKIEKIQGGDVAVGALWLSTDDDHNGLYRVDLRTGEVTDLGTMGHVDGEGEGIDAGALGRTGHLHALVEDENVVPAWAEDIVVRPSAP